MRVYPASLPPVAGEPSAEEFCVRDIDSARGQGVVALRAFTAGDVLFRMNGVLLDHVTQYTLQMGANEHLDDPWFAGKVLHCCDPNSRLDPSTRFFIALRDIEPGDLLTMDYDHTEDYLFRAFDCRCGADACRGHVAGRLAPAPVMLG